MAVRTGLEPATPGVTGRYSNRLNYRTTNWVLHLNLTFAGSAPVINGLYANQRLWLRLGYWVLMDAWQFPTLAWGDPTLPSALRRFTAEFGMGSGGTTALVPPGKFCTNRYSLFCAVRAFGGQPSAFIRNSR